MISIYIPSRAVSILAVSFFVHIMSQLLYFSSQMRLREGNVSAGVCLSTGKRDLPLCNMYHWSSSWGSAFSHVCIKADPIPRIWIWSMSRRYAPCWKAYLLEWSPTNSLFCSPLYPAGSD